MALYLPVCSLVGAQVIINRAAQVTLISEEANAMYITRQLAVQFVGLAVRASPFSLQTHTRPSSKHSLCIKGFVELKRILSFIVTNTARRSPLTAARHRTVNDSIRRAGLAIGRRQASARPCS